MMNEIAKTHFAAEYFCAAFYIFLESLGVKCSLLRMLRNYLELLSNAMDQSKNSYEGLSYGLYSYLLNSIIQS